MSTRPNHLLLIAAVLTGAALVSCKESTEPAGGGGEDAVDVPGLPQPETSPSGPKAIEIPEGAEVLTTESGLQYVVLVDGEGGERPGPSDKITVHYTGMLDDGTVFDSSVQRGVPVPVMMGRVIPGWAEGLALMSPGSKYILVIPPELGYAEAGFPRAQIPPNARLTFEIEMLSIEKGPALPEFHAGNPEAQVTTESGLVYEVIRPSEGAPPKEGEMVHVAFAFWSQEGKLLDCSEQQEMPVKFPVGQSRLGIFNQATLLVEEGARYRFVVPPELAFGAAGAPPMVPPNATTIWELEVVQVMRPLEVPEFSLTPPEKLVTTESGLGYEVIREGTGSSPKLGQEVTVHYAGWLEDGTLFDSSYGRGDTSSFRLGMVVPGWNEGLQLMKEGGLWRFTIPGELGYGMRGSPPKIPPDATLIFLVELVSIGE